MHPHVLERAIALVRHSLRHDDLATIRHERDDALDEQRRVREPDAELDAARRRRQPWRSSQPTGASTPRRGRGGRRHDGSTALRPRGAGPAIRPHTSRATPPPSLGWSRSPRLLSPQGVFQSTSTPVRRSSTAWISAPRSGNSVTRIRSSASTTARLPPSSSSSEARAGLSEARPRRRSRDGPAASGRGAAARGLRGARRRAGQASRPCSHPRCERVERQR